VAREVAESGKPSQPLPEQGNAWSAALSGLGLLDADQESAVCYLWPDNVQAWFCWQGVQTQWRVGMGGPTGLDYAGVRAYLDEQRLGDERQAVFAGMAAQSPPPTRIPGH
jgi:hypothetical protein